MTFDKYSEQAWNDKGQQIDGSKVLSQKSAKKFAKAILEKWKNLDQEASQSYIE